jgi:hypothetical protein
MISPRIEILQCLMNVFEYFPFIKFIPNHITCFHNIENIIMQKKLKLTTLIQKLTQNSKNESFVMHHVAHISVNTPFYSTCIATTNLRTTSPFKISLHIQVFQLLQIQVLDPNIATINPIF